MTTRTTRVAETTPITQTTRVTRATRSTSGAAMQHLAGFADPVHDAQRTFRAVLDAMARPTTPQTLHVVGDASLRTPAPLSPEVGAILLALCDEHTPIWMDRALRDAETVPAWVRFHTGARLVDAPADALFAVASAPEHAPQLAELAQGTDEEPHLSATLLIDATNAEPQGSFTASGPGIDGEQVWDGRGIPAGFLVQWQEGRARFPRGVDVVFTTAASVRALPRTTALRGTASSPVSSTASPWSTTEPSETTENRNERRAG